MRILDRFFQTDTKYLARGSFWLMLGKIAGTLAAFLLSVAYARYLLKDTYGNYRYVLSLLGMAGIFALPGMGPAIARSVARGFKGSFRRAGKTIFICSFGITLFALGAAIFFFQHQKAELGWTLLAAAFLIPFAEGLGSWRPYLDGQRQFRKKTFFNLSAHLFYALTMAGAVGIIYFSQLPLVFGVAVLTAAYFTGHALPNLFFFFKNLKQIPKNSPTEPGVVRYGFHLSLTAIPATIANYLDAVLLHYFLGPAALAIYAFAIAIPEQFKSFLTTVSVVSLPKLSAKTLSPETKEQLKHSLPLKVFKASILTAVLVLIYVILAPHFYQIFFPRYLDSIKFSQIFVLSLILFPFNIFHSALTAEGNMKKIYCYRIGSPIIQIIALAILIPLFGLWGAVWGRIIGRLLQQVLVFIIYKI